MHYISIVYVVIINMNEHSWLSSQYSVIVAGFVCVLICVGSAAMVLPHRSIWVDESTQMSGLAGDPIQLTQWLMGGAKYNTHLQDDRMPPLSYWVGWVWSRTFGLGERQMRWFSVVCTGLATAFVFKTAQRLGASIGRGGRFAFRAISQCN